METEREHLFKSNPPGSDTAIERGCTCPRMDNNHGDGWVVDGLRHWWIAQDCPLHGWEDKDEG